MRGSAQIAARFWAKVDRRGPDECWPWLAYRTPLGYGLFNIDGRAVRAHRVAYELLVGQIPEGLGLDHVCHNEDASCAGGVTCEHRRCVNPAHLEPATMRENALRGKTVTAANARKTHCPKGHEYSHRDATGGRKCRTCRRAQQRASAT